MNSTRPPRRIFSFGTVLQVLLALVVGIAIGRSAWTHKQAPSLSQGVSRQGATSAPATLRDTSEHVVPSFTKLRETFARSPNGTLDLAEALVLIRNLNLNECKEARQWIRDFSGSDRSALMDALAVRWAILEPRDALATALRDRSDHQWRHFLGKAAGARLAERDPEAALLSISNARGGEARIRAAEWLLPELARTNPTRVIDFIASDKLVSRSDDILRAVAREYASVSPHEAITWAESISGMRERQRTVGVAWRAWADKNPAEAAAALARSPKYVGQGEIFESVAHAWSRSDPAAALEWAQALPDQRSRDGALRSLYLNSDKLAPEQMRSLVESISSDSVRVEYAGRVADQMATSGRIEEALAWAESLSSSTDRTRAMQGVIREWSATDPAAAARYATALPESPERTDAFNQAFSHWARMNPDEAFVFGQALPAGEVRDAAMAQAVDAIREHDPQKALQWYGSIEDPEVAHKVSEGLLASLVRVDAGAAIKFATEMPPETQPKAFHGMVRGWAFEHPQEAGNWVNSLPPGEARDSAVKAYVSVIDGMDAGAATQWAYTMQEPTERMETTLNVFHRWLQNDRAAAGNWVQQTDLPDGFRPFFERLLNDQKYAERPR